MTMTSLERKVQFTAPSEATFVDFERPSDVLPADAIEGPAVASLVSPGTETAVYTDAPGRVNFPCSSGYACVIRVENVGADVTNFKPGDLAFGMWNHCSWHRVGAKSAHKLPEGLAPEVAVFARLMGVSMSTLTTTAARPPQQVIITGLGLVGNLAAQLFDAAGYDVIAVDPVESRRNLAEETGIKRVYDAMPFDDETIKGKVSLVVECAGHEEAVNDACSIVRKGGEVVLVGVPWRKRSDRPCFDILDKVFHNYVTLRGGWEWELPRQDQDFTEGSIHSNLAGALRWLNEGRLNVGPLAEYKSHDDAQALFQGVLKQSLPGLSAVVDWRA